MKQLLSLATALLCCNMLFAQNKLERVTVPGVENAGTLSAPMQATFLGFSNPPSLDKEWEPSLYHHISRNESENNEMLERIKEAKNRLKMQHLSSEPEAKGTASAPVVSNNFAGVSNGGFNSPLDNTVAISNNGIIVAFVNSKVAYYDVNGTQLYTQSMYNLINIAALVNNVCDPKVIYDNVADRFIMYAQTCDAISLNSAVVLGFSVSNNPADGWNMYALTGNPLSDGSWFDYPKMGISNDELFVTGNLFYEFSGQFNQSVIYQVPKAPGYAGGTLNWNYWYNLGGGAFTVLPLSWGQSGSYGPGLNLVSTAGSTTGSTNINLFQITNNLANSPQLNLYNVTTTSYSTGGDASQQGSSLVLDAGDCRSLDGFYLNGIIHFVFHSDIGSGWNGVNYNRLTVSTATNVSSTFGLSGSYDYCYPAVASIGATATDKSVIVAFERSGPSIYPETRVVECDDNMTWSSSTLVKGGQSFVDYSWSTGPSERWGDYTGIARKYNDNPPSVWMAGMYGNSLNYWSQWIARIGMGTGIKNLANDEYKTKVYPNPIVDNYRVEFELKKTEKISINISAIDGKLVKELYSGNAGAGKNTFEFKKSNLSHGIYYLNIYAGENPIKHEKIIIQDK